MVIVLDVLFVYWIVFYIIEEREFNVIFSFIGCNGFRFYVLQLNNCQICGLEEELQFFLGSKINVKVGGNSKGILKVFCIYNVLDMKNMICQDLQIEVIVKGYVEYMMEVNEDYEDYEYDEFLVRDDLGVFLQFVIFLQLFEGWRNCCRREVFKVVEEQEFRVYYFVCIWWNGKVGLFGMVIVDIIFLSGFYVLCVDLEKLIFFFDCYVSYFEIEGFYVLLYFDLVFIFWECVGFEVVQEVFVGLVQLVSVVLYDYYNLECRCFVFYGVLSKSRFLVILCFVEVCQCVEGKCFCQCCVLEWGLQDEDGYRMKFVCYYFCVEYGFQVKVF